ncbi:hypothetical protein ES703_21904 [subsurface metagenome]
MYCSNCGKEIEEGSKFCRYCGANVEGVKIEARQKREQEIEDSVSYYDTPKIIPKDMLEEGERIVFETRPRKILYLIGWWIVGILFIIIGLFVLLASVIGGVITVILGLIVLGIPLLTWRNTVYCLTTRRVMRFKGTVSKEVYENPLDRIQDLRLKMSFLQRQYDCGDILITTAGTAGIECTWQNIPNARETYKILRALSEK